MSNIKYRTILFSIFALLLSSFLAVIAVNVDLNRDRELTTVANSDLQERSPRISNPLKQTTNNLDELYQQAAQAQPALNRVTQKVASQLGGEALIPETLKARERAMEKIVADYGGDASRITDLARSSVIFETEEQVLQALDILEHDMNVIRTKNRFQSPVNGYRDVLLNILMPNGHIVEMQLHLRSILEAKYEFGDKLYQEIRAIEADAIQEQRDLTLDETKQIEQLRSQAEKIYNEAFEKSISQ